MYDNLNLILPSDKCLNTDLLNHVPQYLTKITSEGVSEFGPYLTGYLDTLKIKVSDRNLKIYDSSICKYALGDNFKTLSKGDTRRTIEQISDGLHLPIHLANVTRIDVATNLIMDNKESLYYEYLGEASYYKRLAQNNGLYYQRERTNLLFYGKVHEQKLKGQPIPELYENRNVLRYEMRFLKRLGKEFNLPEVTAELLYDEDFYRGLVRRWKNEYELIQKINSKLTNMKPTGSTKNFIEELALYQILELGQTNVLAKVKEWQEQGLISNKQALDLRRAVAKISNEKKVIERDNELMKELDQKITYAARNW